MDLHKIHSLKRNNGRCQINTIDQKTLIPKYYMICMRFQKEIGSFDLFFYSYSILRSIYWPRMVKWYLTKFSSIKESRGVNHSLKISYASARNPLDIWEIWYTPRALEESGESWPIKVDTDETGIHPNSRKGLEPLVLKWSFSFFFPILQRAPSPHRDRYLSIWRKIEKLSARVKNNNNNPL